MRLPSMRNERGIALVVAIVALVVVGAIVAGTFFISTTEQRTSLNVVQTTQALEAAEAGLSNAIAGWTSVSYTPRTDVTFPVSAALPGSNATYQVTVSPLNTTLLLIRSTGTANGVTQTVAQAVRLNTANVNPHAAITTTEPIKFHGASFWINGNNQDPSGWTGCPPGSDQFGIRTSSSSVGSLNKNQQTDIIGMGDTPSVVTGDASVTDAAFNDFGNITYDQLAAAATIQFSQAQDGPYQPAPATTGSPAVCDYASALNWGEPFRSGTVVTECQNYFPTIHAAGSLKLDGGSRGQGILLVDGGLTITGGFEFYGLVIAKGSVDLGGTGSTGGKVVGALMAQDSLKVSDQSIIQGNASVQYSYCAVQKAINGAARPTPLRGRAWTQLY